HSRKMQAMRMFEFKFEPDISLLMAVRHGDWTLETVASYESALRRELKVLGRSGQSTSFIIDIRSTGPQTNEVADELRAMVGRLGSLHARRTAVVTASGLAKLQAMRVADSNAEVFTSLVLARDWVMRCREADAEANVVHDKPSQVQAEGHVVHIFGPDSVDVNLTPEAALETAKRIGNAAAEAAR
ncbi:MAG: hypothetical protein ABW039_13490, partial [Sphingobium sp.]